MKKFIIKIVSLVFITLLSFSFQQKVANATAPQEGICRCHTSVMICDDGNLISFKPRCSCYIGNMCSND